MLNLVVASEPSWLPRALAQLDEILLDHAHCEKKAASTAVKLLLQYPHHAFLQKPLVQLAREELDHFEQMLTLLEARGIPFRSLPPSPYMGQLLAQLRQGEPQRLVDRLLCYALIEARSCERFRILAEAVSDSELADYYRTLLASEARHHGVYVQLAEQLQPSAPVRARLAELAHAEAAVLAATPPWARLHC